MEQQNKTFHIQTFGCQMNERDSETLAGMLEQLGYVRTEDKKAADVAIINTCSVRENADKRFFGTLGQLKKIKEVRPDFVACICGCMMQQQHIIDTVKSKYPWVDVIFGTHNLHEFPKLLQTVTQERTRQTSVWEDAGDIVEGLPARREYAHKAFVNIMYGCDNYCTYCIVPYTRGRERSRRPEDILREAGELVQSGVREITLLGQNVNSYLGMDEAGETVDFAGLIALLDRVPGLARIRFMTSHPKDLSERLIAAYRNCASLCPAIHLPVQSGSDRILAAMNRRYTAADYEDLVRRLREAAPGLCITTDIIVGFPGETEADFRDTLDLCRRVGFDAAFTFLYSPRKGTPAESYPDQVPEEVKHRRFRELVEVINESSLEKNRAYVGRTVEVLVDGPSKTDPAMKSGRTPGFKLVDFRGDAAAGDLVQVRVTEARTFSLKGEQSH